MPQDCSLWQRLSLSLSLWVRKNSFTEAFFILCCCLCSEAAESIVAGSAEAVAAAMISQDTKHMKICSVQITDEELYNFLEVLRKEEDFDNGDDEPQWENTVEKKSHIVAYSAKRRDPKVSKIPSRKSPTPHLFFFPLSLSLLQNYKQQIEFSSDLFVPEVGTSLETPSLAKSPNSLMVMKLFL